MQFVNPIPKGRIVHRAVGGVLSASMRWRSLDRNKFVARSGGETDIERLKRKPSAAQSLTRKLKVG
jgi:hypothetical protein